MCVLVFSTLLFETFLVLRTERDIVTYIYIYIHVKYRHSCQILIKLEFSGRIFDNYSNNKCHENLSSGSQVVPRGRTDRRTDVHTD